jgi:hypothetical protein
MICVISMAGSPSPPNNTEDRHNRTSAPRDLPALRFQEAYEKKSPLTP